MKLSKNYIEKVYSGILGKLIGVYLGRPFEGWSYEKILQKLGEITYYTNDQFNVPIVVTDDDISGTFTFIRALEDYNFTKKITSKQIGDTWLNYIIENRTILWWGGNGISTEHTAWINLKNGIPAPASGSIKHNGKTIAEQIGAQIFIDCWALVSPGKPVLASRLARKASRVSHDGEAVYAAQFWASLEAEAFVSKDIYHLIEIGLDLIPKNCQIYKLVSQIYNWSKNIGDWHEVRELINQNYGYDKYKGNCHIIPNHAIMIMSLLYSKNDFSKAISIACTSGWDTDCNAGNIGCLLGIMGGLEGINSGPDWRGPIADKMIISSADGGNSINDAVKMSYYIANIGKKLSGEKPFSKPKNGKQFHFSLPGSTQGFKISSSKKTTSKATIKNSIFKNIHFLELNLNQLNENQIVSISTPTFIGSDINRMRTYDLILTPLVYPGQILKTRLIFDTLSEQNLLINLIFNFHSNNNSLKQIKSKKFSLSPNNFMTFECKVPEYQSMPIAEIGLMVFSKEKISKGRLLVDYFSWSGKPKFKIERPKIQSKFWERSWIKNVDNFSLDLQNLFAISQNSGRGLVAYGNNDWIDYTLNTSINILYGKKAGIIFRYKGLRRYYLLEFSFIEKTIYLIKKIDGQKYILKSIKESFEYDNKIKIKIQLNGNKFNIVSNNFNIKFKDNSSTQFKNGGFGYSIFEGALSINNISIS